MAEETTPGETPAPTQPPETPKPLPAADKPLPPTPPPTKAEDMISKANAAAARIEESNKKFEELLNRQEQMKVEQTLGGTTEAGQTTEKKELTPAEYKDKVMRGEIDAPKPT